MLYPSLDPNERFRDRRESTRRRKRRRRAAVAGILLLAVLALAGGMTLAGKGGKAGADAGTQAASHVPAALQVAARPRPLPVEIRGVHVTAALASIPGKLAEYEALTRYGLNTIELDVKDEGGEIGFNPSGVALARKAGAVRDYYGSYAPGLVLFTTAFVAGTFIFTESASTLSFNRSASLLNGALTTVPSTFPEVIAAMRAGSSPICSIVASFTGSIPTRLSIARMPKSADEP